MNIVPQAKYAYLKDCPIGAVVRDLEDEHDVGFKLFVKLPSGLGVLVSVEEGLATFQELDDEYRDRAVVLYEANLRLEIDQTEGIETTKQSLYKEPGTIVICQQGTFLICAPRARRAGVQSVRLNLETFGVGSNKEEPYAAYFGNWKLVLDATNHCDRIVVFASRRQRDNNN